MGLSAICNDLLHDGHRAPQSDKELLSAVLNADDNPGLLERLLQRFGNVPHILLADFRELVRVTGSEIEARKIKAIFDMAIRLAVSDHHDPQTFNDCPSLLRYLKTAMGKCRVETLRVLYLDTHNRLISDELMAEGTVNEVHLYPREILRRALDLDSSAFLLAHNHPSQIVTPSKSDIAVTKKLLAASHTLGVHFHDHLIISSAEFHSMRFHGSVEPWN